VLLVKLQLSSTTLLLLAATAAPVPPAQLLTATFLSTTLAAGAMPLLPAAVMMGVGALAADVVLMLMAVPVQPVMVKSWSMTAADLRCMQQ
jgi:hypothetical protein